MKDPRRAYHAVDEFEAELADYCDSPYAIAVNSCTNAITLSLSYEGALHDYLDVTLPTRTYVGVLQAALNTGYMVRWDPNPWVDWYRLWPTRVIDSARCLKPDSYRTGTFTCLSFHVAKQLPLGRGGAILTDDLEAAEWFRAARMDGRPPSQPIEATVFPAWHCPMPPDVAARGLDVLSRWNDRGYQPPPMGIEDYPDLSQLLRVRAL